MQLLKSQKKSYILTLTLSVLLTSSISGENLGASSTQKTITLSKKSELPKKSLYYYKIKGGDLFGLEFVTKKSIVLSTLSQNKKSDSKKLLFQARGRIVKLTDSTKEKLKVMFRPFNVEQGGWPTDDMLFLFIPIIRDRSILMEIEPKNNYNQLNVCLFNREKGGTKWSSCKLFRRSNSQTKSGN